MDTFSLPLRRAAVIAPEDLVRTSTTDDMLPLVVEPAVKSVDLFGWVAAHRDYVLSQLSLHGAVLFRSFAIASAADLERFIQVVSGTALDYQERSSPRHRVLGNVYTSTDYPPQERIFLHSENSYQRSWPMKLFFLCERPAEHGGATPLADTREVLRKISEPTRKRFEERGVRYVRNYSERFGLKWQEVFQTTDKSSVAAYCEAHGLQLERLSDTRLRTRHNGPAVLLHPRTGEAVWFNHAAFFHVSTLPELIRNVLLSGLPESDLPQNTYYGDGSPIEPDVLTEIRLAYTSSARPVNWRAGDLLMVDNMLVAHGREPFSGTRSVLVAMAEAHQHD